MGNAALDDVTRSIENMGKGQFSRIDDIYKTLETLLSESNIDQKSDLSSMNIRGMIRGLTFNNSLEIMYGFRIHEIDILIFQKLRKSVSKNRKGREDIKEIVGNLKAELDASLNTNVGAGILGRNIRP